MSSPRERTDREELLKKKKRERERECAPILLRRNRRRRDLTVSCVKCCVSEFYDEDASVVQKVKVYFKRKAQKEREIFSFFVHF